MDFLPSSYSTATVTSISAFVIFVFSLFFISTKVLRNRRSKKTPAPEIGGAWPVIGHLHLLGGEEPAHRLFSKIADKYGPIFTVKVGVHPTLVSRKIMTLELFSNQRLEKFKLVRESEMKTSVKELYELWSKNKSGWILGGDKKSMKETAKNLDIVVQGWLDEHKKKKASGETKEDEDFMDVMISILQDDPPLFPGRDDPPLFSKMIHHYCRPWLMGFGV
ncbi:hypothetical protein EZV62_021482 [Acer yangbiense]|uniref:Cytochrome P450 n=1 Tax=Acer yangbiense TaxID=1000413 RepID=A0A5C7H5I4_9ROSI|nr:hypothetical protein EZV62_021482 [Acer yangbiense]